VANQVIEKTRWQKVQEWKRKGMGYIIKYYPYFTSVTGMNECLICFAEGKLNR
jgi:hypothetical protein